MLPTRLELRNFLAYRQPEPLLLEGIHLACLTGPNGAGKSSLLDAITWALWGQARLGSDDDLIYQGQSEMLVQLDFLQGNTRYRVVRKRQKGSTPRSPGRTTLNLFVYDEDASTWHAQDYATVRETDKAIQALLRLDYETFRNSAFLQQGKADSFTMMAPAERKRMLGKILGLEQWATYEERAKTQVLRIDHNLRLIGDQIAEIERQLDEEPALQRELQIAQDLLAAASAQRAEAEARYQEVAGAEEQMHAARSRLTRAEHQLGQHQGELNETQAEIQRLERRLATLKQTIAERETIEDRYAQLLAARSLDQALGDKLQALTTLKDRLTQVEQAITAARTDLEKQATAHRARSDHAQEVAAHLDDLLADQADVHAQLEHLAREEAERETLRQAVNRLNEERAACEAQNKALYDEMNAIKARIAQLQSAEAVCPLCEQPLDEAHKASVIADAEAQGLARKNQWIANKERVEEIVAMIKAHQQTIGTIEQALKEQQALRARAGRLDAQVEEARAALQTQDREQRALLAISEMLERGDYAHELQEQRGTLQTELAALDYDHEAHSAARETLNTLSSYEDQERELRLALAQLPETERALHYAQERYERWQSALEQDRAEVSAAQAAIEALAERVQEAQRREDELRQRRAQERQAFEQHTRAEQRIAALEQSRERKADLLEQQQQLTAERSVYQELRDAFGKNGVPAMIIEAVLPELEEAANQLLAAMTNGRMHVRLDTQREKRTGGVAETLAILISDELGTRSYEAYSGGEAFRINFAIRVALSQLLARRAGAQLRTLFLDEGFGTQDEVGRQRLVEAINAVQDQFDLLLAITHIDELRDAFPVQIAVTKTPDGSRVELR